MQYMQIQCIADRKLKNGLMIPQNGLHQRSTSETTALDQNASDVAAFCMPRMTLEVHKGTANEQHVNYKTSPTVCEETITMR